MSMKFSMSDSTDANIQTEMKHSQPVFQLNADDELVEVVKPEVGKKKWWKSRTIITNATFAGAGLITALNPDLATYATQVAGASVPFLEAMFTAEKFSWFTTIFGIANIVLRVVTAKGIGR